MARSDYDIINLSLKHELNEWLTERGYAGLADNRNRLAEVVTRKLQDSFYINVSWEKVVHRSHAGMRIAVPHKHHPGFLNTGHGDKRTMIVFVSLIDFR